MSQKNRDATAQTKVSAAKRTLLGGTLAKGDTEGDRHLGVKDLQARRAVRVVHRNSSQRAQEK